MLKSLCVSTNFCTAVIKGGGLELEDNSFVGLHALLYRAPFFFISFLGTSRKGKKIERLL